MTRQQQQKSKCSTFIALYSIVFLFIANCIAGRTQLFTNNIIRG